MLCRGLPTSTPARPQVSGPFGGLARGAIQPYHSTAQASSNDGRPAVERVTWSETMPQQEETMPQQTEHGQDARGTVQKPYIFRIVSP
jgi:hypothetical protein